MATSLSLQEKLSRLDKLSDGLNKSKGKVLIGRVSEVEELQKMLTVDFIQTPSLNVNEALGGGWPRGRITIVSGNEDSGKTFLLLETIGKEMERNPDFVVAWLESEGSITAEDLKLFNIDPLRFLYISVDRDGAAEEALDRFEGVIMSGAVDMAVVNSLKCLVPKEELDKSMGQVQVGLQARMNAKMMRKVTGIVAEYNVAAVFVQHLTTQIGTMSRDPLILAGGKAIRYGASIICDMRKRSIQESDPIKKEEGVKIGFSVTKNHVVTNRFPYLKTEYYGLFGVGTEIYLEAIDLAIKQGLLVKAGAFIKVPDADGNPVVLEDGTKLQWQGTAKFRAYCMENPDFFNNLKAKLEAKVETLSDDEIRKAKEDNDGNLDDIEDVIEEAKVSSKKSKKK